MNGSHRRALYWAFALSAGFVILCCSGLARATDAEPEFLDYFSATYVEARNKFLYSAEVAGARVASYRHPLAAPDGAAMYTDVVLIGPEQAELVLVLSSGTHGVEGFAGSAVQTGLLQQGIHERIPPNLRLVMIHAINPYGFAHRRRVNEDNIDLNRSFIEHTVPYPKNPGYDVLAEVAAPESLSLWENTKARLRIVWFQLREGKLALKRAISQGQFSHPDGLFYGGHSETWSSNTLAKIAGEHLSTARRVVFIDFHTGLGAYGEAEVIMNVPPESPAYIFAEKCWGDSVRSTVSGESVSVDLRGTLKLAIPGMLPQAEAIAVSLEFGTFPALDVFWALRAENWLYHHGVVPSSDEERIKSELMHAFYPQDDVWKRAVWDKGKQIVEKALICLPK